MAVAPTGAIYKAMTIDGESSRTYGVYITGQAVYNAPQREVEMISVPGRNGQLALDKGHFENLEVTYPAGIYADTEAEFADAVSNFRNFLCSRSGYVRIEDEYNPNEYRMGIYKSGLEVETAGHKAGEFEIIFNCKPQRFLSSGETKTSVPSGGTVTNPTLLESSPMLEFKGYGSITLGGQSINVDLVPMGDIIVSNGGNFALKNQETTSIHAPREIGHINIDVSNLNNGDKIYTGESSMTYNVNVPKWVGVISSVSVSNETGENWSTKSAIVSQYSAYFTTFIPSQTFSKGTASTKTYEYVLDWVGSGVSFGATMTIQLSYDGNQAVTLLASTMRDTSGVTYEFVGKIGQVNGNSTVVTTSTFYIDLDIGDAYFLENEKYTSANYAVSIPAKLPKLAPGSNTITYSNTITNFKITPRWWKL